jgi:hypothetical protein
MAIFLSYGHLLFGIIVITACAVIGYQRGWRQALAAVLMAGGGVIMIAAAHLALGFNWLTGLHQLRVRYYQGIAAQRPYGYFVWANIAAWLISCSPLLVVGIVRAIGGPRPLAPRRVVHRSRSGAARVICCAGRPAG